MKRSIKQITIIGKRWFDRVYGNTYHSVVVYVNGESIGKIPFQYGYDEGYIQSAFALLQDKGFYPKTEKRTNGMSDDWSAFCDDRRNFRNKFVITVSDVSRKKDL